MKQCNYSREALFQLNGIPPLGMSISLALQHLVAMIVGCVTPAIIIANALGLPQSERVLLIQVSLVMSAVTTPAEEFQQKIGDRGWVAVCDPTCGAGALLVAFANECRKKEINYQTDVLFVAQDIDYIVGMMCYLQMSLLGMPGYVVIGDTLASPSTSYDKRGLIPVDKGNVWYTPLLRICSGYSLRVERSMSAM